MEVARAIRVEGRRQVLCELVERVTDRLEGGWRRDRAVEQELRVHLRGGERLCIEAPLSARHPEARLTLDLKPGELVGQHVFCLPSRRWPEPPDERTFYRYWNLVQTAFFDRYLAPAAEEIALDPLIAEGELALAETLPLGTKHRLERWLSARRMFGEHEATATAWRAFLTAARKDRVEMSGDLLGRWMREDQDIPEEEVRERIAEYAIHRRS